MYCLVGYGVIGYGPVEERTIQEENVEGEFAGWSRITQAHVSMAQSFLMS